MDKSLWINKSVEGKFEKLNEDKTCDILIIGGGIVGITTAYLLAKQDIKNVILVEANKIGHGASGNNTGKLSFQNDLNFSRTKKTYGIEKALMSYKSSMKAIDTVKNIIDEEKIECNFKKVPSVVFTSDEKYVKDIENEYGVAKEIGIDCSYDATNISGLPIDIKAALQFNESYEFNPKIYIDALAKAFVKLGGVIYENTPINDIKRGDNLIALSKGGNKINTEKIVLASHYPFYDDMSLYVTRLKPERSYAVAGKYDGQFPEAYYINIDEPTRSLKMYKDKEDTFLIIAGENHRVGTKTDINAYEVLENYGNKKFGIKEYKYRWSAEDYTSPDYIPYIGRLNKHNTDILVATGFSKWGMLNGIISGTILSDILIKGSSEFEEVYDTGRMQGYLSKNFIKDNIATVKELVMSKLEKVRDELPQKVGEANVVKIDGEKFGAYKGSDKIYYVHITCPHMGCNLKWNATDKSWDCPCHGSRFNYKGELLEGPATECLNKIGDGKNKINPHLMG